LFTVETYCFAALFLLGLFYRGRIRGLSLKVSGTGAGSAVTRGGQGEIFFSEGLAPLDGVSKAGSNEKQRPRSLRRKFFRLPAVLVRCELRLKTRDGKTICHVFDPDAAVPPVFFPAKRRGVYYGSSDRFSLFDAAGFFRLDFPIPGEVGPRLIVAPQAAEELIPLKALSGGAEQRREVHYRKTDDLTDHRPYIPGDDPRRINWKLYGHAPLGELFVREGENEPPPHSRLLILIDSQADESLYTPDQARNGVDLLCENALAAALEYQSGGLDVFIGHTGGMIRGGAPGDFAPALAWPYALSLPEDGRGGTAELPKVLEDCGILILALPREAAGDSALERFLRSRREKPASQVLDLAFLYPAGDGRLRGAAETCALLYGRRPDLKVRQIPLGPLQVREK
jgi:hypothetical protein